MKQIIMLTKKSYLTLLLAVVCLFFASGQDKNMPGDFLNKDFHAERRQKLREKMPARAKEA